MRHCFSGLVFVLALAASPALADATAAIVNTDKKGIGKATFEQTKTGVLITVEVTGLPPGPHGIHLHSVGTCDPNFKASKGHINPGKVKHGLRNPAGPDNGDLPNIFAASDGKAQAEIFTTRVSLTGSKAALLDSDGSALIIHANRDDHLAQPIGGAGGRIACGVIK